MNKTVKTFFKAGVALSILFLSADFCSAKTPIITSIGPSEIMRGEKDNSFTKALLVIKGENLMKGSKAKIRQEGESAWRAVQTIAKTDDNDLVVALIAVISRAELSNSPAKFELKITNSAGDESNLVGFSAVDGECREPLVSSVEPKIVSLAEMPSHFTVSGGIFSFNVKASLVGDDNQVYAELIGGIKSNFELVLTSKDVLAPEASTLSLVITQPFCSSVFEFPSMVTIESEGAESAPAIASIKPNSIAPKETKEVTITIANPESFDFMNFAVESVDRCLNIFDAEFKGLGSISAVIEAKSSCTPGEKQIKVITGGLELNGKITALPKK